jgi:hypothetical protein
VGSTSAIASMAARSPLPPARRQAADRVEQGLLIGRGWLDDGAEAAERHDPDLGLRPLARDEGDGSRLGRLEAGGGDVGRAHAAGHVHREDDRRLVRRDADHHGRPAEGEDEGRRRGGDQGEREMTAEAR